MSAEIFLGNSFLVKLSPSRMEGVKSSEGPHHLDAHNGSTMLPLSIHGHPELVLMVQSACEDLTRVPNG